MKSNNERQKFFKLVSFPTFIFFVLIVILVHILAYVLLGKYFHTWEEAAHFGEMFVVTHSLFDGLAFVALLFTILLQQSEIQSQKNETKRTANIQIKLVEVLAITAQMNAQSSLLASKNRAYDRSIANNIPATSLDKKSTELEVIEKGILNSVNTLNNLHSEYLDIENKTELLPK